MAKLKSHFATTAQVVELCEVCKCEGVVVRVLPAARAGLRLPPGVTRCCLACVRERTKAARKSSV